MTPPSKTLYNLLAVAADASDAEIQVAYEQATTRLQLQKGRISADDYDFKVKVLNVAFKTLSAPASRAAYDAKLAVSAPPAPAPALALVPLQPEAEALSLRAEAMALRADAMTLRADAMVMRSGAAPFRESRNFAAADSPLGVSSLTPILRKILLVLGTLFAIASVVQVVALVAGNRQASLAAAAAAKASEATALQEYYQTHGVRPANQAALDALLAEERRKDTTNRTAEREKARVEQEARRFEEESRRRGEQVSSELRMAELQAKEQARREDERREWQQKEDARAKEQMERNRIERQKAEWREVLRR
ncbi:hypothetical protein os1_38120 [Comamonadaceae bacterium OS-1]|nr:hypothetical protein os1_38120 [Comamonadaceae bacterium OS-1]